MRITWQLTLGVFLAGGLLLLGTFANANRNDEDSSMASYEFALGLRTVFEEVQEVRDRLVANIELPVTDEEFVSALHHYVATSAPPYADMLVRLEAADPPPEALEEHSALVLAAEGMLAAIEDADRRLGEATGKVDAGLLVLEFMDPAETTLFRLVCELAESTGIDPVVDCSGPWPGLQELPGFA